MGDRIVVMKDGRIEQIGAPLELYDHPANVFVAGFIGSPAMNFVPATLRRERRAPSLVLDDGTRAARRRAAPAASTASRSSSAPGPSTCGWRATAASPSRVVVHRADRRRHLRRLPTRQHRDLGRLPRAPRLRARQHDPPAARPRSARICSTPAAARGSPPDIATRREPFNQISTTTHADRRHRMTDTPSIAASSSKARPASPPSPASAPARPSCRPLAHAQTPTFKPEKGAKLRVLRWSRFVQGDIDAYMVNVKKFTEKTGHRGARRQRGLGRRAPEGGGGRQHRRRPRHHPVDQRRREPLSRTSCSTSPTSPTTSARSTAAGTRPASRSTGPTARSGSRCRSAPPAR